MQKTPLYDEHLKAQARIVPFAGWEMPVQYPEGILAEHLHTRTRAGLFDISHMGEFRVQGPAAAALLDQRLARAVIDQPLGSCRYNLLLNNTGGILDDLVVYRLADEEFLIVVNAGCIASDAAALSLDLPDGVSFTDESATTAKLDLQGPESAAVLAAFGWSPEALPRYFRWTTGTVAGVEVLLSRTGYTGELGFELYCAADQVAHLWQQLLTHPAVKPIGLGARDTLRLEVGYPLYGHELDTQHTPDESALPPAFTAATDRAFTGKEAWQKHAPASFIKGLKIDGRRAARAKMPVLLDGATVGVITSGAFAPSLGYAVALARFSADLPAGTSVTVDAGRGTLPATIVEPPFYAEGTARMKLV